MAVTEEDGGGVTLAALDADLSVINANLTNGNNRVLFVDASLSVSATAATGVAVTATLPSVAAQFHHITAIDIMAYSTAARVGVAAPILVTSTNLPGANAWDFATTATIGTTDTKSFYFDNPYRSTVAGTATTIVCPAITGIIWRVNVYYYTA